MPNHWRVVPRIRMIAALLALLVPLSLGAPAYGDHGRCKKACHDTRHDCDRQCKTDCRERFPDKKDKDERDARHDCERACRDTCKEEYRACKDKCDDDVSPHKP